MEHDWLSSSSVWLIEPCVLEKVKPSAVLCCVVTRCLVHLSRGKAEVGMFAPDENQMHVINHLTGSPAEGQSRYVSVCLHNRIICWWENLPWINQGFLWVSVGLQNVSSGTRHFPMSCVMPSCVLCVRSSVSLSLSVCVFVCLAHVCNELPVFVSLGTFWLSRQELLVATSSHWVSCQRHSLTLLSFLVDLVPPRICMLPFCTLILDVC